MTKIKIQIKSRFCGTVLFEYEKENNTIKDTLIEAVRQGANLLDADLRNADLRNADLRNANLLDANLWNADLRNANLLDADLRNANLLDANLWNADLRYADLRNADLRNADLQNADLRNADLRNADLQNANLQNANLAGAMNIPYIPLTCPSEGAFVGWKKVHQCLIKLLIPEDARRSSATTTKCRCDKAQVLDIRNIETWEQVESLVNKCHKPYITYRIGEVVLPDSFDDDRWNECSHGIHFFINKQDALNY